MDLEKAKDLAVSLILTRLKHRDYDRVTKHAKEWLSFISGEGLDGMLRHFVPRESKEMFEQRKALTHQLTEAICSSLIKPFFKVARNKKVKKIVEIGGNEKKAAAIQTMIKEYYGDKRKTRGLDYWINTRLNYLTFSDPNAWIVIEWEQVALTEVPRPYPVEYSSEEVFNFEIVNEVTKWMIARKEVKILSIDPKEKKVCYKTGEKFVFYNEDNTLVYEEIDVNYMTEYKPVEFAELSLLGEIVTIGAKKYRLTIYTPNTGYVTAMRVGYQIDVVTKGRTFVTPLKAAESFLKKSIKTVSEQDLTMTLHVFPQKIQYVDNCPGESPEKRCNNGVLNDGGQCGACKGTGKKVSSSAQDAILLPMPEHGQDNIIDLNNVLVYKSPETSILQFQKDYVDDLEKKCHLAVFNSLVFIQQESDKTATAVNEKMESVYDTLEPYTTKISEAWIDIVSTFATILDIKPGDDDVTIVHRFPSDPKLKTMASLLNDLKLANDSKAPGFLRESITDDIADILFSGDDIGLIKYKTQKRFFPFNGKTQDEINQLLNSSYVSERTKVLAANFGLIMDQLEKEHPGFYLITNYKQQWELVEAIVDQYLAEIKESQSDVKLDFSALDEEQEDE